jgi:hypothetical protein
MRQTRKEILMKKLILSAVTVAAFSAGGMAFAQDGGAECQAGSAWGNNPGCGGSSTPYQAAPNPGTYYGYPYYGQLGALSQLPLILSDGRLAIPQQQFVTPYARTDRDRDGDGIRNSRDRYPDDPRYR